MSLDEAYLDVTENAWGEPLGRVVAQRIKREIREATGLTASAGVAPNKFLAKIASAWKKPDGLTVIAPERVEQFLQRAAGGCALGRRPGHRRSGCAIAASSGSSTCGRPIRPCCARRSAASADWLRRLADGMDDRPVEPHRATKSSGTENTYSEDLTDINEMRQEIDEMARDAAAWLARKELLVPHGDDQGALLGLHHDHAQPLGTPPTRDADDIAARAVDAARSHRGGRRARSVCSASACTTSRSVRRSGDESRLPF